MLARFFSSSARFFSSSARFFFFFGAFLFFFGAFLFFFGPFLLVFDSLDEPFPFPVPFLRPERLEPQKVGRLGDKRPVRCRSYQNGCPVGG